MSSRIENRWETFCHNILGVLTFWRPSWTPSWIMEKAPAGITGSFSMLFLMVFGRFPEKFSFGIFFPLQNLILFAYLRFVNKNKESMIIIISKYGFVCIICIIIKKGVVRSEICIHTGLWGGSRERVLCVSTIWIDVGPICRYFVTYQWGWGLPTAESSCWVGEQVGLMNWVQQQQKQQLLLLLLLLLHPHLIKWSRRVGCASLKAQWRSGFCRGGVRWPPERSLCDQEPTTPPPQTAGPTYTGSRRRGLCQQSRRRRQSCPALTLSRDATEHLVRHLIESSIAATPLLLSSERGKHSRRKYRTRHTGWSTCWDRRVLVPPVTYIPVRIPETTVWFVWRDVFHLVSGQEGGHRRPVGHHYELVKPGPAALHVRGDAHGESGDGETVPSRRQRRGESRGRTQGEAPPPRSRRGRGSRSGQGAWSRGGSPHALGTQDERASEAAEVGDTPGLVASRPQQQKDT